jgi:hypothetical protein
MLSRCSSAASARCLMFGTVTRRHNRGRAAAEIVNRGCYGSEPPAFACPGADVVAGLALWRMIHGDIGGSGGTAERSGVPASGGVVDVRGT